MPRCPTRLLPLLALGALASLPLAAQNAATPAGAGRYAARREGAYSLLGSDLLVVRSRWSQAGASEPGFEQDPTFYYYTGMDLLGAVLVLDGATRRAELFLARPQPGTDRAAARLPVDGVEDWSAFPRYIDAQLAARPRVAIHVDPGGVDAWLAGRLGTPLDTMAALANPHLAWRRALQQRWPNAAVATDTAISSTLRSVKDAGELAILRRVAMNSVAAFKAGLARFAPGRRQRDVEAAVVEACTRLGDGAAFWPWAMTGPNAAFPVPFSASLDAHNLDRVMRAGEVARFDIGCKADHYMGDVGRTVPVSGTFTPGQAEVIDLLAAVYRAGVATIRDGAPAEAPLQASVAEARRRRGDMRTALGRHAAALLTEADSLPYWQAHGIGLEYAEPLPPVLKAGMVLDYEPIFVVDGQGFYMEDMILVTPQGSEILTRGLPSTAAEIQRAMQHPRAAR